jgi:hypothetical protein
MHLMSYRRVIIVFGLMLSCLQASRTSSPRAPSPATQQMQESGRSQQVRDSSAVAQLYVGTAGSGSAEAAGAAAVAAPCLGRDSSMLLYMMLVQQQQRQHIAWVWSEASSCALNACYSSSSSRPLLQSSSYICGAGHQKCIQQQQKQQHISLSNVARFACYLLWTHQAMKSKDATVECKAITE